MDLFAKKYCDHKQDYCLLFTLYSQNYTHILLCFVMVWWQRSILPIVFKVTSLAQYYGSPSYENLRQNHYIEYDVTVKRFIAARWRHKMS